MFKRLKKGLVTLLAGIVIATTAGAQAPTAGITYAAQEQTVKDANSTQSGDELKGEFPSGTVLKSDSFEGLKVTYDGKDSYTVKSGLNKASLEITVLDAEKAKKSLPLLSKVFGEIKITIKKGNKVTVPAKIVGIDPAAAVSEQSLGSDEDNNDSGDDGGEEAYYFFNNFFFPIEKKEKKEEEKEEKTKYVRTITIYLDGTNLETGSGFGTKNLLDMLEADIPANTKVIVITGGTKKWHMDDIATYKEVATSSLYPSKSYDDLTAAEKAKVDRKANEMFGKYRTQISGTQMWEVVNNGTHNEMKLVRSLGDAYMVDPSFLTRTIDLSTEYAPADKYDLIIWDHGGGFAGYGDDEFLGEWIKAHPNEKVPFNTTISTKDLSQAIANTQVVKNGQKFDFIGFDACLMASFEVASTLSKYADYYIASEELEPGQGWDYKALFNALGKNPTISTADLGGAIVDSFLAQYDASAGDKSTLSVVDLNALNKLNDALSSFALILVSEADNNYYSILSQVGTDSHFGTKNGFYSSNVLDIKRLVTPFADDDGNFSDALKKAGKDVLSALEGCVLVSKTNDSVIDGGLSIYFPIQAFYERSGFEENTSYFNDTAKVMLERYGENNVNSDYSLMAAKLAVRSMAGRIIGGRYWTNTGEVSLNEVYKVIDEREEWKYLLDFAGVDRSNQQDPVVRTIQQLLDDRVHAGKINITISDPEFDNPEDEDSNWHFKGESTVNVNSINAPVLGDRISVKVTLFDKNEKFVASLGNTLGYSSSMTTANNANVDDYAEWSVRAFDQLWYAIDGQITSMYITDIKDDGSFSGYIPLAVWNDVSYVAGTGAGDKTRTEYLIDAAKNEKVDTIRLYVECTMNGNTPEIKAVSYDDFREGETLYSHPITDLADRYVELLGGADELFTIQDTPGLVSLGTVYVDDNGIDINTYYVAGLSSEYYISDYYGNTYELTKNNLGKDGLEAFYERIPKDITNAYTWEESQKKALEIRGWAAEQAGGAAGQANNGKNAPANERSLSNNQTMSTEAPALSSNSVLTSQGAADEAQKPESSDEEAGKGDSNTGSDEGTAEDETLKAQETETTEGDVQKDDANAESGDGSVDNKCRQDGAESTSGEAKQENTDNTSGEPQQEIADSTSGETTKEDADSTSGEPQQEVAGGASGETSRESSNGATDNTAQPENGEGSTGTDTQPEGSDGQTPAAGQTAPVTGEIQSQNEAEENTIPEGTDLSNAGNGNDNGSEQLNQGQGSADDITDVSDPSSTEQNDENDQSGQVTEDSSEPKDPASFPTNENEEPAA